MKYRVDDGGRRKLQPVGHRADFSDDSVGAKETKSQLMMRVIRKKGLDVRLQFEVNPVLDLKLPFGTMRICLLLHPLLGPKQMLPNQLGLQSAIIQPGSQI